MKKVEKEISPLIIILTIGMFGVLLNNIPQTALDLLLAIIHVGLFFIISHHIRLSFMTKNFELNNFYLKYQKIVMAIFYIPPVLWAAYVIYIAFSKEGMGLSLNNINTIVGRLFIFIGPAVLFFSIAHKTNELRKIAHKEQDLPNKILDEHPELMKSGYFKSSEPKIVIAVSYLLSLLWLLLIAYVALREGSTFLSLD